ncbi:MAG: rRNA pseudouridine synthase [Holosporaceae bacterium]|nr:rRNA pseudouridine synthase [Holosporaceae bacterium]
MTPTIRLAKKIAESGIASRREAERIIESGRVIVDGQVVKTLVFFVSDESEILIDGKRIPRKSEEAIIWKFYKPRGVITSRRDPGDRKTVFDFFPNVGERLLCIGRLDYNSEGLLLFTNNGSLARKFELPDAGLKRIYRVRIFGALTEEKIRILEKGITVEKVKYKPADIRIIRFGKANSWITAVLSEGKNREIRKMAEYVGCTVNRLIRTDYGPFGLGGMTPGQIVRALPSEIAELPETIKAEFAFGTSACRPNNFRKRIRLVK